MSQKTADSAAPANNEATAALFDHMREAAIEPSERGQEESTKREGDFRALVSACPLRDGFIASDELGNTALMIAAMRGRADWVEILLPVSPVLAVSKKTGIMALELAVRARSVDCVQKIADFCSTRDLPAAGLKKLGNMALHRAVDMHQVECAKILAAASFCSDPNEIFQHALPLFTAVVRGKADMIEALLPYCDTEVRDAEGNTPLIRAVKRRDMECVRILMKKANLDAQGANGQTALMWAAREAALDLVKILAPVSNVSVKDNNERSALEWAIAAGPWDSADLIASLGTEQDMRWLLSFEDQDETPLTCARFAEIEAQALRAVAFFGAQSAGAEAGACAKGDTDSSRVPESEAADDLAQKTRRAPRAL